MIRYDMHTTGEYRSRHELSFERLRHGHIKTNYHAIALSCFSNIFNLGTLVKGVPVNIKIA